MLTPQDIAEKPLNKVRFGGYDMGEVDDFLEQVGEDYASLYKENAILKGKLKVLVEKIEEYRTTEDSMRMALLTSQKVAENIKTDADKQREAVLRDANEEIKAKLSETAKRVADEELRLSVAAKETSKFIELSQAIMKRHSEFLTKLEGAIRVMDENRPAPSAEAAKQKGASTPSPVPAPIAVPTPPAGEVARPAPIVAAPAPAPAPAATPATSSEILPDTHIVAVADEIDSAMQRITQSSPPVAAASPPVQPAAVQTYDISSSSADSDVPPMFRQQAPPLYDPNTAPTTTFTPTNNLEDTSPRPKFDFDDLRFGENF